MFVLHWIDGKILAACTKFSHWFQRLTGRTNFFLAKIGVFVTAFSTLVETINYFTNFLWFKTTLGFLLILLLLNLFLISDAIRCDEAENKSLTSEERTDFFRGRADRFNRILWLLFSLYYWTIWFPMNIVAHPKHVDVLHIGMNAAANVFSPGLAIFYYFICVVPLPPGKSRVKEWLEKFRLAFNKPQLAEIPSKN